MIVIIGRKIIIPQGDDDSFRIILKDKKGKDLPLSETDVITLRMRYMKETENPIIYKKESDIVKLRDEVYHIFHFSSKDLIGLPSGEYEYDVILENENKRFTIIPKSILVLEESISYDDIENNKDIQIFDVETKIDYESVIAATPLVGIFPEINYRNSGGAIDEEIILF